MVVIDCLTGDLLCLLSAPAYDPNVFSEHVSRALWADLMADDHHPLINKSGRRVVPARLDLQADDQPRHSGGWHHAGQRASSARVLTGWETVSVPLP